MAPIVTIVFVLFVAFTRVLFRAHFHGPPEDVASVMALQERRAIRDPKLLTRSLIVLAVVALAFTLQEFFHLTPSIIALVGAGVMLLVSDLDVGDVLREVEWPTLAFFMGLFIMVAGLVHTGVIETVGTWSLELFGDNHFAAATSLLFGSAILGAFVDNIPYVATMAPVVEDMAAAAPDPETGQALWWAFALGADFGGNGTAVAASANVVAIGMAARSGYPISFWQFTRYGIIVTILSVILAWVYVWLRYF
jgi:Na+/H+ antiporter NhaD/arsenite permease-like protein